MEKRKVNTGSHEAQGPHTEAECRINEHPHDHPSTDCGHYVDDGPGSVPQTPHGDLNLYGADGHDSGHIAAGAPRHDADQDPEHGPGIR